jgi:hypothetical protein
MNFCVAFTLLSSVSIVTGTVSTVLYAVLLIGNNRNSRDLNYQNILLCSVPTLPNVLMFFGAVAD